MRPTMTALAPATDERRRAAIEVVRELRQNYAAWAARCYTIQTKAQELVRLRLNRVQQAIGAAERDQLNGRGLARIYVLKARQGGVTTDQQARALHTIWCRKGAAALTVAHERDATDKIFEITRRAVLNFPSGLLPVLGDRETREVSFPGRDSRFYTGTAGARRTGRSLTLVRLHGSEFAFWDKPRETLNAATPALESVPGSVIVLETTASAYGSEAHDFWLTAQRGGNDYQAVFFPWWECDPDRYRLALEAPDEIGKLEPDEQDLVTRHGLDLEQVKWRRKKVRDMGRPEFLREYAEDAETCWLTAGGGFFDAELLKHLRTRAPKPRATDLSGTLRLYGTPTDGDPYDLRGDRIVIGCDTAEGGGGDRSAWTARAFAGWRLVAEFEDAKIEPKPLAALLNGWGRRFATGGRPAFLVVEKNAHGITVLRHLRDDHKYPLDRMYRREQHDDPAADTQEKLGWLTSAESQPRMLDAGRELLNAAKEGAAEPPSASTVRDAFGVHYDPNGRVKLTGRDLLVSEMLAWLGREQMVRRTVPTLTPVHY